MLKHGGRGGGIQKKISFQLCSMITVKISPTPHSYGGTFVRFSSRICCLSDNLILGGQRTTCFSTSALLLLRFLPVEHVLHVSPQGVVKGREIWWTRSPGLWTNTRVQCEAVVFERGRSRREEISTSWYRAVSWNTELPLATYGLVMGCM
jgi:hypothetical protein